MTKVVLITGTSSGFGSATARLLASKGYRVYGISRRIAETAIPGFVSLPADVRDAGAVKQAVATLLGKEGRIDVLINNAGMGISGPVEECAPADISLQMDTNFYGYVNLIQAVLPAMRKQKSGTIINVSSIGGLMGLPYQGFYSASKFAIEGLSEGLRMELLPFGIKVVLVQPGDFSTGFTASRKPIELTVSGSEYEAQFRKTMAVIEKDEKGGLPPEKLAKKLACIVEKKNPCPSYIVSTLEQKFAVVLKRILPGTMFSGILASHYGIKG
jgi:NAD(P)-dependent dehydrogenase (short-subunit alcohol dehydrogenase family)